MGWAAAVGFWVSWGLVILVVTGFTFLITIFTSDSPANRGVADRLINVLGVILLLAIAGGIAAMRVWPGWPGWLAACRLSLLIPVVVIALAGAWMK